MTALYPHGVDILDAVHALDLLTGRGLENIGGVALTGYGFDALGGESAGFGGDEAGPARLVLRLAADALLAGERAERAEREAAVLRMTGGRDREALAALQAHVAAGHVLCTDCDGHGTWSIGADDGCEIPCECAACDGTGWRDAVSELAAYRLARAALQPAQHDAD